MVFRADANRRVADSLLTLFDQVEAQFPSRDDHNDGTIGDDAHASRDSNHNASVRGPDGKGVVTAIDITHDPAGGFDAGAFAESLRVGRDDRINNVIFNGRIFSSTVQPWIWRERNKGPGDHSEHIHVAVGRGPDGHATNAELYDDPKPWTFSASGGPGAVGGPVGPQRPKLKLGSQGDAVRELQQLLGIEADGFFGSKTDAAVRAFQASADDLVVDGIVGSHTWGLLLAAPRRPMAEPPATFRVAGKMSTFGGPADTGMSETEGLALFSSPQQMQSHGVGDFLLTEAQAGAPGLGRRLNPAKFYVACRWPTDRYPFLRHAVAFVSANGKTEKARPMDWGPAEWTGRVADLSPGLASALDLGTDDICTVTIYEDQSYDPTKAPIDGDVLPPEQQQRPLPAVSSPLMLVVLLIMILKLKEKSMANEPAQQGTDALLQGLLQLLNQVVTPPPPPPPPPPPQPPQNPDAIALLNALLQVLQPGAKPIALPAPAAKEPEKPVEQPAPAPSTKEPEKPVEQPAPAPSTTRQTLLVNGATGVLGAIGVALGWVNGILTDTGAANVLLGTGAAVATPIPAMIFRGVGSLLSTFMAGRAAQKANKP